jgi:hypothetical protein
MNSHAIDIYEEKESWGFYIDFENESENKNENEDESESEDENDYTNQNDDDYTNQNDDDNYKTKKSKCCTANMLIKVSSTTLVSIISVAYFIIYIL